VWPIGCGIRCSQHLEDATYLVERPESRERVERLAHGDDELWLVVLIAVVAVIGADRDPVGLFTGETGASLLGRRMRLQRERLGCGEELQEEREPGASGGQLGAECLLGLGSDPA
jgi:hypothetical protein